VLRARFDAGELDRAALREEFASLLAPLQRSDGFWPGYWWATPWYTTAFVLEVWLKADSPPLSYPFGRLPEADSAFDIASRLFVAGCLQRQADMSEAAARLLTLQHADGAWPGDAGLRVPPSHPHLHPWQPISKSHDARRIFTTATAVRALAKWLHRLDDVAAPRISVRSSRSSTGVACDNMILAVADRLGCHKPRRDVINSVFVTLTADSLDERTVWPAAQLSSLSGGAPLEFSAPTEASAKAELRYTVEPATCKRLRNAVRLRRYMQSAELQSSWDMAPPGRACVPQWNFSSSRSVTPMNGCGSSFGQASIMT